MTTTNQTTTTAIRPSTPAQHDMYIKNCMRNKVTPVADYKSLSYDELYALNAEFFNKKIEVSEAQKDRINKQLAILANAGQHIKVDFSTLTGGKNGTAWSFSEFLNEKIKAINPDDIPASVEQLNYIAGMFLCPDVPLADLGVTTRIELEEGWRKPTKEEIVAELTELKISKAKASEFIDKNKVAFYDWKNSRISEKTVNFIKTLQDRVANKVTSTTKEWVTDADGNAMLVEKKSQAWNPTSFIPMPDEWIVLLSKEEGDKYILQLQSELKKNYNTYQGADNSQTFEEIRNKKVEEFDILNELIYGLNTVAGYDSGLHEKLQECTDLTQMYQPLKDFFTELIESDAIDFGGIVEMIKDSQTAVKALMA
jgi:hypothetical protein